VTGEPNVPAGDLNWEVLNIDTDKPSLVIDEEVTNNLES